MIVVVKPKVNTISVVPDITEVTVNNPVTTLSGMSDVTTLNINNNDILQYQNGYWVNSPVGADANYIFNQASASSVWNIVHNLNKFPNYTVIDSAGDEVEGDVTYINNQQLTITFSAAFSGTAYLN